MTETVTAVADAGNIPAAAPTESPKVDFNTFVTSAPPELKDLLTKNGVKDFDTLSKSYTGLNSMLGKKGLIKPDDNAPDDIKAEYQKKLYAEIGVPETGEYEFSLPEGFKEEEGTQAFLDQMAGVAHKSGMSQAAYQEMVNFVLGAYSQMKGGEPDFTPLKEQWGKDFDANIQQAKSFYDKIMKDNPLGEKLNAKFGNDPDFLAFAHQLAGKLGEDSLDTGKATPSEGKAELNKQAVAKTQEAMKLLKEGRYKDAEKLQQEARELYSRAL